VTILWGTLVLVLLSCCAYCLSKIWEGVDSVIQILEEHAQPERDAQGTATRARRHG
jgi:hypothetical protein